MFEDLRWLGIRWQEGPDIGGPFAPYAQSQRRDFYLAAWNNSSIPEPSIPAPVPAKTSSVPRKPRTRASNRKTKSPSIPEPAALVPGALADPASSPAGVNWRFRVPDGELIRFHDQHFGPQSFVAGRDFGDFLVWRRDDVPAYQLAVVVDDAAMQITEVVRGADLIRSTARQLLLYRALGLTPPAVVSLPARHRRLRPAPRQAPRRALPSVPAPARRNARQYPHRAP